MAVPDAELETDGEGGALSVADGVESADSLDAPLALPDLVADRVNVAEPLLETVAAPEAEADKVRVGVDVWLLAADGVARRDAD